MSQSCLLAFFNFSLDFLSRSLQKHLQIMEKLFNGEFLQVDYSLEHLRLNWEPNSLEHFILEQSPIF